MGLCVTFVSGPRRSGKSRLIQMMVARLWTHKPHYIRLIRSGRVPRTSGKTVKPLLTQGVASTRSLEYDAGHIFEILPEALTAIHRDDRFGSVVIEADADAVLRHAYPYDHRIFVMPTPTCPQEIFRDPRHAAVEFERVLDDTQAFASEIFGLFAGGTQDGVQDDCDPSEERPDLSNAQMRAFLYSPLGDELATRIQLQQTYHGLVESDVIVVNDGVGERTPETEDCLRRVECLLERTRGVSARQAELFRYDPQNQNLSTNGRILQALKPMCLGGN